MFLLTKDDLIRLVLSGESADLTHQIEFGEVDECADDYYVLIGVQIGTKNMGRGGYVVKCQLMLGGVSRDLDVSVADFQRLQERTMPVHEAAVEEVARLRLVA